ncbi:MAG: SDR family oxidoreductase [Rhodobacteraceae bacterium]|nr:SDR family oxidoreductase [Paracoccaceae bacterium]
MTSDLLSGRRALVTGGAGRIGRAVAATLLREGASVALADLAPGAAAAAARALDPGGGRTCALSGDVAEEAAVEAIIAGAEAALGLPDLLVTAHGIFPNLPLVDMTQTEWDRVFAVNLRGPMFLARGLARRWIVAGTRGGIVNITSGAARSARAGSSHYASSKAAFNMMTEVLAIELGPHGIRVNAVAPGLILDAVVRATDAGLHPYINDSLRATPLRRTGAPEDIAEAVAFLASDRSPWTTGAVLEITGGSHCGRPHVPLTRDLK